MTMPKLETIIVAAIIAVVMGAVLLFGFSSHVFGATTPSTTTAQYATESTGAPVWILGNAVTGPNSTGATGYVGYIQQQGARQAILSASTTPCAIQNPLNATSTIVSFNYNITTATSTASSYAIGTSTTAYATTTTMETVGLGAGQQSTITWNPGANNAMIGPGQFIVVGNAQGQVFYPFAHGGTCSAVFQSI